MRFYIGIVFSLFLILPARASADLDSQKTAERALAKKLEVSLKCKPSQQANWEPNCFLSFEGLEVELVSMRANDSYPNIYVWSVGKGQSVMPRGARCIEVKFKPSLIGLGPDETTNRPSILIHGSGVLGAGSDSQFRDKCSLNEIP